MTNFIIYNSRTGEIKEMLSGGGEISIIPNCPNGFELLEISDEEYNKMIDAINIFKVENKVIKYKKEAQ